MEKKHKFHLNQSLTGKKPFDCVTVSGSMVGVPTFEAKSGNFLMNHLFHFMNTHYTLFELSFL